MAAEHIIYLDSQNFENEVLQSETPVLVDFWAQWCGPCKMLSPILDELASEYEGKVKIGKVDVDKNQELSAQYSVLSIPTLLIFKDGKVQEQHVGLKGKPELKKSLDAALA